MKSQWKILIPFMLSGGLSACSLMPTEQQTLAPVEQAQISNEDGAQVKDEGAPNSEPQSTEQTVVVLASTKTSDGKLILGEKEWVYVPALQEHFRARIDTGATTSSISAVDIVPFERDGKDWVKFRIEHDGIQSGEINLPVERWVHIRQSASEGGHRRPVVVTWIQIGELKEKTEFTLANRTHLTFPILLGRSFFKDVAIVDVSQQYVQEKQQN
ncbi:ATP-dependent zinc protease family protein [Vibrio cincinnatiensis]